MQVEYVRVQNGPSDCSVNRSDQRGCILEPRFGPFDNALIQKLIYELHAVFKLAVGGVRQIVAGVPVFFTRERFASKNKIRGVYQGSKRRRLALHRL